MARLLRLKHHLRAEPAGEDAVFLIGERERFLLRGRAYRLLSPLLERLRTADELADALAAELSAAEVDHALRRLEQRGYVVEAAPQRAESAGFWQALGEDAGCAATRLAAMPVAVRAGEGEDPGAAVDALAQAGVTVREDAALVVFVSGDYLSPELDGWNRRALREGISWIPIKPGGIEPWMGPVFRPGAGPCWACLAQRLRYNRPVEAHLERRRGAEGSPVLPP
ncbi:MAG: TOMM precursor leader peptide-binding protein, partial [Byssovorax sp.]